MGMTGPKSQSKYQLSEWAEWMEHPQYGYFWSTYTNAHKWMNNHFKNQNVVRQAVESARIAQNGSSPGRALRRKLPRPESKQKKKKSKRELHINGTVEAVPSTSNSVLDEQAETMDSDTIDEMSAEMKAFMLQTIQHRQQRDAARAIEKEARQEDDYISADKIGVHGIQKKTTETPNEREKEIKKREEAKKLYGLNAEKILAMEAVLDMGFQTEYTAKKPSMWPNIPLRL